MNITKNVQPQIGLMLIFLGTALFVGFVFALTVVRFSNPHWTETELMLWSLRRWWGWAPELVLIGIGIVLVRRSVD